MHHITLLYRQYLSTLTCINQLIHINHANKHVLSVFITDQHTIIFIHTIQCLSLTWYAQYACKHIQYNHISHLTSNYANNFPNLDMSLTLMTNVHRMPFYRNPRSWHALIPSCNTLINSESLRRTLNQKFNSLTEFFGENMILSLINRLRLKS